MHVDACSHHPVAAQYCSDQALHVFNSCLRHRNMSLTQSICFTANVLTQQHCDPF